jgi:threonine/homoserine/homoserine lactone efflux protein
VEIIGLAISLFYHISWVLDILIVLFALYLAFLAVRGWRKQINIDMPDILQGKTVRKRHWRLF